MKERGFSLVETLVALVVLSAGMLGVSALLVSSLRQQSQALRHQAATRLVADVADRLRANGRAASTDLAHFVAQAATLLPGASPEASLSVAPATGPGVPAPIRVTLRWRDSPEADAASEVSLVVYVIAPEPVAG
jgi:type IV pilus assembly protein PilV